eukprot:Nitzschia sp. Nitz4//scaffold2_size372955//214275//214706//NITZ4_000437-RA/size372955-snap-gene-0.35-mRNA-1//1//CDS//3329546820//997//frame0
MPIKFNKAASTRLFRYVKAIDIKYNPFDSRTKSTREIWRQMQASRYYDANPNLAVNTVVSGGPEAPEIVFKFVDDSEKRFDAQHFKANEILFDVHLFLDRLDNEYEMAGKSVDD